MFSSSIAWRRSVAKERLTSSAKMLVSFNTSDYKRWLKMINQSGDEATFIQCFCKQQSSTILMCQE